MAIVVQQISDDKKQIYDKHPERAISNSLDFRLSDLLLWKVRMEQTIRGVDSFIDAYMNRTTVKSK